MPDDQTHVIRGIHWRETFPFTHIFRSFLVAVHPSKLVLALVAILLLYLGGRALDAMWPLKYRGVPNEIELYEHARAPRVAGAESPAAEPTNPLQRVSEMAQPPTQNFWVMRKARRDAIEADYAHMLESSKIDVDGKQITHDGAKTAAAAGKYSGVLKWYVEQDRDERAERARLRYDIEHEAAKKGVLQEVKIGIDANPDAIDPKKDAKARSDARDKIFNAQPVKDVKDEEREKRKKEYDQEDFFKAQKDEYEGRVQGAYKDAYTALDKIRAIDGRGPFVLFLDYEIERINGVVYGVTHNNWFGGLTDNAESGVFHEIVHFFCIGPGWALKAHSVYFVLFAVLFLIVWAIFGGAIARIAAVHVAREEKLSIRQALGFASGKFLSFVFAPVIPLAIIVIVGIVVAIGGLLVNIPYIGEILVGVFFFLALAAGFVMTLVALGTAGGLNLMYPTIAVEGSDSFDAISRSFSYVYARPWRMLWYTVVAIVYGALTYLFVRLFIFLTLWFTHKAAGAWVWRATDAETNVWNSIWPGCSFWHLPYAPDYTALHFGSKVAALLVSVWVYLVIALLGAYLISYYFSASTVIYYLMRREVDATELDDVYLEQSDDEFAEPTGAAVGATVTTTTTTTVVSSSPAPAAEPAAAPPPPPPAEGAAPPG
jgi:hypothetical protein